MRNAVIQRRTLGMVIKSVVLGIRLQPAEREALDAAAREDARPVSALVRKIVLDWLRERHDARPPK